MKRVLFVDDEPRILEGLQRLLRPQRSQWEMVFAPGGEEALGELEAAPFDVIVSDIRMPGVDGPQLLQQVRERFPSMVRIVLSGHTDLEGALRSVAVAHQFLAKPCDTDMLKGVVERACELRTSFPNDLIRRRIGAMGAVPSRRRVYEALTAALADHEASVAGLARIIENDVAMCAKLLQLLNSAFFGLPRRSLTNVETAVGYLGTSMLRRLVLSVGIFQPFDGAIDVAEATFESLQRHAIQTSRIAARLLPDRRQAEEAFMAGLLHNIGKIVMTACFPEQVTEVAAVSHDNGHPVSAIEAELRGVTHAQIGAYLLGLWGLPTTVVEAVKHHHTPPTSAGQGLDVNAAVYVADHLAHECAPAAAPGVNLRREPFDAAYLEALGGAQDLSAWRSMARETVATMEEA